MRLLRKRFYRLVRRLIPLPSEAGDRHERIRRGLSIVYMISAWQLVGVAFYMLYSAGKEKQAKGMDPVEFYATAGPKSKSVTILSNRSGKIDMQQLSEEQIQALRDKKAQAMQS